MRNRQNNLHDAPELGFVLGGRFELVRFLGAGGMGAVYEAVATDSRRVAVKVMLEASLSERGAELVERFKREIVVTSTLQSPHIVPTLDAGMDDEIGAPFLVMPLLSGLDLARQIERSGALHPTVAARVFRQGCRAVELAHEAEVIHRDIKPANFFLEHHPSGEVTVRLFDFGIAKCTIGPNTELTRTGSLLGTLDYMAPEQLVNVKDVDARCDVWGLGVALYQVLSNTLPFEQIESPATLMNAIVNRETKPLLQDVAPWVDSGLAAIVHGALLRDRELRCPSVAAFAEALEPHTGGSDELEARMFESLRNSWQETQPPLVSVPKSWNEFGRDGPAPTPMLPDADPLLGKNIGSYTLVRRLGRGGMGAVYEATGQGDQRVAIKVIRPELAGTSTTARRRFAREARVVQQIESDNVVRIHEIGSDSEHELPYIVMDLLNGADLNTTVRQHGPLDPDVVARIFLQACDGLTAAHALGFVHRDVKPANLFLHAEPSGRIVVKVCDFGIAKEEKDSSTSDGADTTENLTGTGGMLGSPMYMSPEQATNAKAIDHRTDVWSLGASMFHALSGVPPWEGRESVGELVLAVCTHPVPDLQQCAPWVSGELADMVRSAMSKEPESRLPSIATYAERLRKHLGDQTEVLASELRPLSKTVRVHKAPRKVVSVDAGGDASGVASTIFQAPRSRRWPWYAAGALVTIGAAAWWMRPSHPVSTAPPTTMAEPSRSAVERQLLEVAIDIAPAGAQVLIEGRAQQLVDGRLVLVGEAGDKFEVEVRHGEQRRREVVVISRDGTPSMSQIALDDPTETDPASPQPLPRSVPKGVQPVATTPPEPKPPPEPEKPKHRTAW